MISNCVVDSAGAGLYCVAFFVVFGAILLCSVAADSGPSWFSRTDAAGAQWFPDAGFGLFMHWGIHSVEGAQPSWAMIKDYPYGGELYPPERYYALAERFDPQNYGPDKWMKAAKKAGFTYAVLTTKHHDGYCLWPTEYGKYNTGNYMDGRNLLKPYVEACRNHGIKVGFYFSPRDWSYPNFPLGDVDFNYNRRGERPPVKNPKKNKKRFEEFYEYTIGQLGELLTRYGEINVMWFDGMGWHGIDDIRTKQTIQWIRKLQPHIVINDRWGGVGDFETVEWQQTEERPHGWWEYCISWNGHWGYNPDGEFRSTAWVLSTLAKVRAWGGNFLLNCGPAPDGTMPEGFHKRCDELAKWMRHSKESVIGAGAGPWPKLCDVPVTTRKGAAYLHFLPDHDGPATLQKVPEPEAVALLASGKQLQYDYEKNSLTVAVPSQVRGGLDDVVIVRWGENRPQWDDVMNG